MKKSLILPLLIILSGCNGNTSSLVESSSTESSSDTLISSSTESSSSSSVVSSDRNAIHDLKDFELELEEKEDESAYLISKYKGTKYNNIRLPESYNNKPIVGIKRQAMISASFENIYIPDCYTEFNQSAFFGCTVIKNYFLNETHSLYKSIDGVLYTKDGDGMYLYPSGRRDTYKVLEGTKRIESSAFMFTNVVNVELPESIEEIGESAFNSAKRLKTINIPSKVEVIKESTFDTCGSLKTIEFNEGLEKIEYRAFWQCRKLQNIKFPSSLKEIGESAFEGLSGEENLVLSEGLVKIGDYAFAYNEYIQTITFPSTLKEIGKYAFMQNYTLKELYLAEGLEKLDEGAFFYNNQLQRVHIPSTLKEIGFDCFASSDSVLSEFIVSENSETFKNQDGIIYTKDGKQIVCCPSKLTFENGTYSIPEGVEVIGDHAFYNCSGLKKVILPSTLKTIGKAPFYVCGLTSIEYTSTIEDFNKIQTTVWEYNTGMYDESDNLVIIEIYWYMLNYEEGRAISTIKCSDGDLNLLETNK